MISVNDLNSQIKEIKSQLEEKKKTSNKISTIRLIISLIIIIYAIKSLSGGINFIEGTIIVFGIAIFIVFVVYHTKIKSYEKYLESKITIIENYIFRIDGNWVEFNDIGEEALDSNHVYTNDLDIFGKGSLFQLINTTKTFLGREILINTLSGNNKEKNIEKKQEAVKEISDNLEFSIEMQTLGKINIDASKSPKELIEYAESKESINNNKIFKWIVYALPVILVVSSFLAYITLSLVFLNIALAAVVISIVLNGYFMIKGYVGFSKVNPFKKNIKAYLHIIKTIEKSDFKSEYLKNIENELKEDIEASKVIKKLESIVDAINLRYNPIAYFILNLIFLWDYQCMFALEDFKAKYGKNIGKYLNAVGEMEEIISLSVVSQVNESTCYPLIDNKKKVFVNAVSLGHPLIKGDVRITNDIGIDNQILVITGSNMSGKTTFLRTVGINLVLAYSGAAVLAEKFSCCNMRILTSMRIVDNLEMGISTFYAELLRIKNIIEASKSMEPMIFLIDEIFRGTNSQDRIVGAINVLKSLSKQGVIGCISTHDFELCSIDDKKIENYHFEEYYENGKILFDYKIKLGRSTTKNAKYLMKMVGINIEE